MAKRRTLGFSLLLVHLLGLAAPALAQAPPEPRDLPKNPVDVSLSENIEQRAGGWNVATPLLIAGSELYQGVRGEGDGLQASDVFNRRVMSGFAGDVGALGAVWLAAKFVPLPPVAKIALMTAAGFLGWEFASGDFRRTDWVELGAQIAAASAVQFALPVLLGAAGLTIGPVALMAAGIAAAVGTGMLVSWLRNRNKDKDEGKGDPVAGGREPVPPSPTPFLGPGTGAGEPEPEPGQGSLGRDAVGGPPTEDLSGLPSFAGLESTLAP